MHWKRVRRWSVRFFVACSLLSMIVPFSMPIAVGAAGGQTIDGTFTTIDGDPQPGTTAPSRELYFVTNTQGAQYQLSVSQQVLNAAGGVAALDRKPVTVTVDAIPAPAPKGNAPATVNVSAIGLAGGAKAKAGPEPLAGSKPFINVLCKFSDVAAEPQTNSYFTNTVFSASYPGVDAFWRENSFNTINLGGTTSVGWLVLPSPRATYIPGGNANLGLLAQDCTAAADATVNFNNFQGINLFFNDLLDCCAWGGSIFLTLDGTSKAWPMTWMPPWGYIGDPVNTGNGITVLEHETGHAFGLRHSADQAGVTYNDGWDDMSGSYWHCDLAHDATLGCLGRHTIARNKDQLGWIPAGYKFTYSGTTQSFILSALSEGPVAGQILDGQVNHDASPSTQWTTVEMRSQFGNDVKNPYPAVIIHDVDTGRTNPAWTTGTDGFDGAPAAVNSVYNVPGVAAGVKIKVNSLGTHNAVVTIGKEPNAATAIHTTGATATSVSFAWTAPDSTAYTYVSNGSTVTQLNPGVTTFTQNGLTSGQWGCISTETVNGIGLSTAGWTGWVCGQAGGGAPPQVSNLRHTDGTSNTIVFSWNAPGAGTSISVSDGTTVTNLGANASTYTLPGVSPGGIKCLSVLAYNGSGNNGWSNWVCGYAQPVVSVVSHNSNSVTFNWTAPPANTAMSVNDGTSVTNLYPPTNYVKNGMSPGSWVCISVLEYNSTPVTSVPWTNWVCGQAV